MNEPAAKSNDFVETEKPVACEAAARQVDQRPTPAKAEGKHGPSEDTRLANSPGRPARRRLHPATMIIPLVETVLGSIVPLVIAGAFIGYARVLVFGFAFFLLPSAVVNVLRWLTVRYQLDDRELIIQSGAVFRRERRISFDRIQDVEVQQGVVARLGDLAKLEITTAGSDSSEAVLDCLTRVDAETIKDAVSEHQVGTQDASSTDAEFQSPRTQSLCRLSPRDLVVGGLSSNLVATVMGIVGTVLYFKSFLNVGIGGLEKVDQRLADGLNEALPAPPIPNWAHDLFWEDTLGKSLLFALVGFVVSVASYVIRYHGFHLTRRGDVLSKTHGLLQVRQSSVARGRVQALKIEEGLLRRLLHLAAIRVDSAGDRDQIDERKKRDVLVPVVKRQGAHALMREIMPGLRYTEPVWNRISPLAVMRGSKKGWLLTLLVMLQTYIAFPGWFCLAWLPAFPLVYFLNVQWYRNTGYWMDENHLMSRKGWLNRETIVLPTKNVQNVTLSRGYFDRRLGLATLAIDTAGQSNTGGGPVIRHLPVDEARQMQQWIARQVSESAFAW